MSKFLACCKIRLANNRQTICSPFWNNKKTVKERESLRYLFSHFRHFLTSRTITMKTSTTRHHFQTHQIGEGAEAMCVNPLLLLLLLWLAIHSFTSRRPPTLGEKLLTTLLLPAAAFLVCVCVYRRCVSFLGTKPRVLAHFPMAKEKVESLCPHCASLPPALPRQHSAAAAAVCFGGNYH